MGNECHTAMPLFEGDLSPLEGSPVTTTPLVVGWDRAIAPASERIAALEDILGRLPDAADTCATLKGLLVLIDDEMKRINEKLRGSQKGDTDGNGGGGSKRKGGSGGGGGGGKWAAHF